MMRRTIVIAACVAGAFGCTVLGLARSESRTAPAAQPSGRPSREQLRARHDLMAQIVRQIQEGNYESARSGAQSLITSPLVSQEIVEGHRLLALIARHQREFDTGDAELQTALTMLTTHPEVAARSPWLRATIVMDQADLAAFGRQDRARAITLYDQVLAQRGQARLRDVWIASQNAAMLCAELGRVQEAVERVDALLASPAASEIPESERLALRASQSSWPAQGGDPAGAMQRSQAVWRDYQGRDDYMIFKVGLRIAQWLPVTESCNERLAIASTLLSKLRALRASPTTNPSAPTSAQLDDLEHETLVVIANSLGCDDPLVPWARQALGLSPQP